MVKHFEQFFASAIFSLPGKLNKKNISDHNYLFYYVPNVFVLGFSVNNLLRLIIYSNVL